MSLAGFEFFGKSYEYVLLLLFFLYFSFYFKIFAIKINTLVKNVNMLSNISCVLLSRCQSMVVF